VKAPDHPGIWAGAQQRPRAHFAANARALIECDVIRQTCSPMAEMSPRLPANSACRHPPLRLLQKFDIEVRLSDFDYGRRTRHDHASS